MAKRVKLQSNSLSSTGLPPSGFKYVGYNGDVLSELDSNGTITTIGSNIYSNSTLPINTQTILSSATVTPIVGNDLIRILNQSENLTIANPTGVATEGIFFRIRIKGNGTAYTLSFGDKYRSLCSSLPTVLLTDGKNMYFDVIYNSTDDKWDILHYHNQLQNTPISFLFEVKTNNPGITGTSSFKIPTKQGLGYAYNYTVTTSEQTLTNQTGDVTLTWSSPGTYEVEISGTFPSICFDVGDVGWGNQADRLKIINIKRWGSNVWKWFERSFWGCKNLDITALDFPNLSLDNNGYGEKSLSGMFSFCNSLKNLNGSIENWNISQVTDLSFMFSGCSSFNVNLNNWNVSNVKNMESMLSGATIFNKPVNNWNVSNVINFYSLFLQTNFNSPIFTSVSNLANRFGSMFRSTPFNQDISMWDMSNAQNLSSMFESTPFNQPLNSWNVSNVIDFSEMFKSNSNFNKPLNNWILKTSGFPMYSTDGIPFDGINMSSMFDGASNFNQNISGWNTSAVAHMDYMFYNTIFNQNISGWNVSNVRSMYYIFSYSKFNQNISNWNMKNVTNMEGMFFNNNNYTAAILFNYSNWTPGTTPSNIEMNWNSTPGGWKNGDVNMSKLFANNYVSGANYTDTLIRWAENMYNAKAASPSSYPNATPWYGNNFTSQTGRQFFNSRPSNIFGNAAGARSYLINTANWTISGDTVVS
jgi:surface protein